MCYKQKCKVVSLNLAHPVVINDYRQTDGQTWRQTDEVLSIAVNYSQLIQINAVMA